MKFLKQLFCKHEYSGNSNPDYCNKCGKRDIEVSSQLFQCGPMTYFQKEGLKPPISFIKAKNEEEANRMRKRRKER